MKPFKAFLACLSLLFLFSCTSGPSGSDDISVETVSYGSNARQKYDVYSLRNVPADAPVIVFFYGGGWDSGNKARYEPVGRRLAEEGFIAIVADYRLHPEVVFPEFVKDGASAVAKVKREISPNRPVFVMGHSAGAHIAALIALNPSYLNANGLGTCRTIAGFIGISGPYDFLPFGRPDLFDIFPPETREESQPINYAGGRDPASLLVHGKADFTVSFSNSTKLADALRASGGYAETVLLEGVSHPGPMIEFTAFSSGDRPTLEAVKRFVLRQKSAGYPQC